LFYKLSAETDFSNRYKRQPDLYLKTLSEMKSGYEEDSLCNGTKCSALYPHREPYRFVDGAEKARLCSTPAQHYAAPWGTPVEL
jgi:hypothetical protein